MSAKIVSMAARQLVDEALSRSQGGESSGDAASNFISIANGAALGPATTVTFSAITNPKIGGAFAVEGMLSGTGTAGQLVTVTLRVNGSAFRTMTVEVSPTTSTWQASMSAINNNGGAGYPVGTAVTFDVHASAAAALTVPINQAMITTQEVPLT